MKIRSIRVFPIDITPHPVTRPRSEPLASGAFASPTWRYAEFRRGGRPAAHSVWQRLACLVTAEDGTWGLGLSIHSGPVQRIIEDSIAPALLGMDCMAIERVWDAMNRMTAAYGTGGLASYAISAIDTALWDLKGRLLERPVYELLGGPQKDRIFCYGSNTILSYGLEASLEWFLELGFRAVKIFMDAGPEDGLPGLNRTEERVARAREIVGDDVELMLDCWMSLDVDYAARLLERLEPYRLRWVEDLLLPEDQEGYVRLRQRNSTQSIATRRAVKRRPASSPAAATTRRARSPIQATVANAATVSAPIPHQAEAGDQPRPHTSPCSEYTTKKCSPQARNGLAIQLNRRGRDRPLIAAPGTGG